MSLQKIENKKIVSRLLSASYVEILSDLQAVRLEARPNIKLAHVHNAVVSIPYVTGCEPTADYKN